jgi:hypothetical protein
MPNVLFILMCVVVTGEQGGGCSVKICFPRHKTEVAPVFY